jgi:hypothetical protein
MILDLRLPILDFLWLVTAFYKCKGFKIGRKGKV